MASAAPRDGERRGSDRWTPFIFLGYNAPAGKQHA